MTVSRDNYSSLYARFQENTGLTLKTNSIFNTDYARLNQALSQAASSPQKGSIYYTENGLQFLTKQQAKTVDAVKVPFSFLKELCASIQLKTMENTDNVEHKTKLFLQIYNEVYSNLNAIEGRQTKKSEKIGALKDVVAKIFAEKDEIIAFEEKVKVVNERASKTADAQMIKQTIVRATALREFYEHIEAMGGKDLTESQTHKTKELTGIIDKFSALSKTKLSPKTRTKLHKDFGVATLYLNNLCSHAGTLANVTRDRLLGEHPKKESEIRAFFLGIKKYFSLDDPTVMQKVVNEETPALISENFARLGNPLHL